MEGSSAGSSFGSRRFRQGLSLLTQAAARPYVIARARIVFVSLLGLACAQALRGDVLARGYEPFAAAVARHGLSVDTQTERSVLAQRKGEEAQLLIFHAHEPKNPGEVWIAEAIVGRDGRVAELSSLHNLTRTSSADEGAPELLGHWALSARKIEGEYVGLELFDLASEPPPERGGLAKLQRGITNLQQTGRFKGIGKRTYTLTTRARTLAITREAGRFVIAVDGARAVFDPALERPVEGVGMLEVRTRPTTVSALVPWLVDTAREVSWIGPERIAWLENKVFALRDRAMQAYHSVSSVDQAEEAAEELGIATQQPRTRKTRSSACRCPTRRAAGRPPASRRSSRRRWQARASGAPSSTTRTRASCRTAVPSSTRRSCAPIPSAPGRAST